MTAGLPWDDPDSDPLADIAAMAGMVETRGEGGVMYVGARSYDLVSERLGHPFTVADLPPGIPGRWAAVVRLDPFVEDDEACPDCGERPCHPQCLSGGGLEP